MLTTPTARAPRIRFLSRRALAVFMLRSNRVSDSCPCKQLPLAVVIRRAAVLGTDPEHKP